MAVNIPENKNRNDYFKAFGLLGPSTRIEDLKTNIDQLQDIGKVYWEYGYRTDKAARSLYGELANFYYKSFYKAVLKSFNEVELPVNYTEQDIMKVIKDTKRYAIQKSMDLTKAALDYMAGIDGNFNEPAFGSVKYEDIVEFDPTLIPKYISVVYRRYLEAAPIVIGCYDNEVKLLNSKFIEINKGETKEIVDKHGYKTSISL